MTDVKTPNLILEMPKPDKPVEPGRPIPQLRAILARHAQRQNLNHHDMLKLHREGFNHMRPVYLEDGTILFNRGAYTAIQHPDNRIAVIFDHNPDKIRRVEVTKEALDSSHTYQCSEISETEGLIVVGARECDKKGLPKSWVERAVDDHDLLMSRATSYHGILKRTGDDEWSTEGRTYTLIDPDKNLKKKVKLDENDTQHHVLRCGYGLGLMAGHVAEHETRRQKLIDFKKRVTWDAMALKKERAYNVMSDDFEVGAPRDIQGFNPHDVTYKSDFHSEFSKNVVTLKESNIGKKNWFFLQRKSADISFLMISGIIREFRKTFGKSAAKAVPGAVGQFIFRAVLQKAALGFAASVAAAIFLVQFLSNTISGAKKTHLMSLSDMDDVSHTFYKYNTDEEVMSRRFQEADPEQIKECRALSRQEYDFVPLDAEIHEDEPKQYDLNRFLSTDSVREGSRMEAFRLNAHDVTFYDESHGLRRVVIPDLKTAFVTYVGTKEDALETSQNQKAILDQGEVIKVVKNEKDRIVEFRAMSYSEFEENLLQITQEREEIPPCVHPQNVIYLEQKRQEEAEKEKKMTYRVKRRLGLE
ncbi:MAG: hypothetical protein MRY79_06070 [Alphaproteobacteria bacterium]|nr:hypothetical protein [Alphaproteobacteria bacterium]